MKRASRDCGQTKLVLEIWSFSCGEWASANANQGKWSFECARKIPKVSDTNSFSENLSASQRRVSIPVWVLHGGVVIALPAATASFLLLKLIHQAPYYDIYAAAEFMLVLDRSSVGLHSEKLAFPRVWARLPKAYYTSTTLLITICECVVLRPFSQ